LRIAGKVLGRERHTFDHRCDRVLLSANVSSEPIDEPVG